MGSIVFLTGEFTNVIGETIGFKSGMVLSREEFADLLAGEGDWSDLFMQPDNKWLRLRSDEFEELYYTILYKLGNTDLREPVSPYGVDLYHKYKKNPTSKKAYRGVSEIFNRVIKEEIEKELKKGTKLLDPTSLFEQAFEKYGTLGIKIANELITGINNYLNLNPYSNLRRIEWKDTKELKELFNSASLETSYGKFLDRRFINYLERNFSEIDQIHWRKFEALTAEYFVHMGYEVEIGPGRNDNGVDVRVWDPTEKKDRPPLILIQCKRQKKKVEKIVVKALWADVKFENAKSGLIVTTSCLSPGSVEVCKARQYDIFQADRKTLEYWITQLKEPGTGIFLGY